MQVSDSLEVRFFFEWEGRGDRNHKDEEKCQANGKIKLNLKHVK